MEAASVPASAAPTSATLPIVASFRLCDPLDEFPLPELPELPAPLDPELETLASCDNCVGAWFESSPQAAIAAMAEAASIPRRLRVRNEIRFIDHSSLTQHSRRSATRCPVLRHGFVIGVG